MNAVEDVPGARQPRVESTDKTPPETQTAPHRQGPRTIRSEDLFGSDRMVVIEHGGENYRLTITRNDKLILQK